MSLQGINDVYISEGTFDGERFEYFLRNCLCATIELDSVIILDNASIHHVQEVTDLMQDHIETNSFAVSATVFSRS